MHTHTQPTLKTDTHKRQTDKKRKIYNI